MNLVGTLSTTLAATICCAPPLAAKPLDAEGLAKWINNQHSDGLFPEVPEPEATHQIPAASLKTESHEAIEQVKQHSGDFTRYSVAFGIKNVPAFGDLKLKDFTDKASVFVGSKSS